MQLFTFIHIAYNVPLRSKKPDDKNLDQNKMPLPQGDPSHPPPLVSHAPKLILFTLIYTVIILR